MDLESIGFPLNSTKRIINTFFGEEDVTVSGLLTGQDIIAQLKGKELGDLVLLSNRVLNENNTVTLDDMNLKQISNALNVPVKVVYKDNTMTEFNINSLKYGQDKNIIIGVDKEVSYVEINIRGNITFVNFE